MREFEITKTTIFSDELWLICERSKSIVRNNLGLCKFSAVSQSPKNIAMDLMV